MNAGPTEAKSENIRRAIEGATSLEEVARLEQALLNGNYDAFVEASEAEAEEHEEVAPLALRGPGRARHVIYN